MTVNYTNESFSIQTLFHNFFIKPIIERTGYNPVTTATYGILLVIGAYLLFKLFKRLGYKINWRFFKASIPFILLISVWRALTDAGVYPYTFLTTTPGLYLPVLLLFLPLIILAKKSEKRGWKYEWLYSGVSTALLITQLIIASTLINKQFNWLATFQITYFTLLTSAPFIILNHYWKPMKNKLNFWMIISHLFDASVTHVSLKYYNYFEQHVIPNFIFNITGSSLSFFPWKIIVLGAIIYLLDYKLKAKNKKDQELINFIKMIFITYGIATGIRGLLRLGLGV